ncbi:MAG: gamma-glutamylcyclotransferase family protein, partial [Actinomycetota bacterium]
MNPAAPVRGHTIPNSEANRIPMPLLFVYGTLKRGHRLHHHMLEAEFLGSARTTTGFALYRIEWYPAMVTERDGLGVSGELYEASPALLELLDEVEGAPDLFQRVEIELAELDGQA